MSEEELPEGWAEATLGEIADIALGKMLDREKRIEGKPLPYLRNINVRWGTVNLDNLLTMPFRDEELSRFDLRLGDLLICEGGEPGRAAIWSSPRTDIKFQKAILRARMLGGLEPRWAMYSLRRNATDGTLEDYFTGSTIKHFPQVAVRRYSLPLPPLAEQRRIVEKVEALLAQVNATRARLAKVATILKRFRQSILSAACSGRLTDICEDDEWASTDLQSIAMIGTGSTPLRSNKAFYAEEGTPWITSAATSLPIVTHADEFVTEAAVSEHRLKKYPIGTLLVAMYGEGKTRGQVTELGIEAAVNQACSAIVVDGSKALRSFVKLVLQANYLSMRELAEGGNQPNLSLGKMKELPISLPPLSEQHEIVRRVDALFKLADAIEARVAAATARADKITQAILAKAFRGELVPTEAELARQEGRDYEPASALLARIRAERTASEAAPKPARRTPRRRATVVR